MRNLVWRWEKNTHTLGMNCCSRFNVCNLETLQTFDVTANKFNVYRIPNDVISYSHKKFANKQNNNCSRYFVAKGGRSTGKSASWVLFRISRYFLLSCLLYFIFLSWFVFNVFLGVIFFNLFLYFYSPLPCSLFPFYLFTYFNPCCNLMCYLLIVSTYVINISRLTHLQLLGTVRSTRVQVLWSVSKG
jgi:hypothetical protein